MQTDAEKSLSEQDKIHLRAWAEKRDIKSYDCCEFLDVYSTDEKSALTQVFAKGKWGGLSVREGLQYSNLVLQVLGENWQSEYEAFLDESMPDLSDEGRQGLMEFSKQIWEATKNIKPLTKDEIPHFSYYDEGDILHIGLHIDYINEKCRREWINDNLTITRAEKTGSVVGIEIGKLKSMLDRMFEWLMEHLAKQDIDNLSEVAVKIVELRERK